MKTLSLLAIFIFFTRFALDRKENINLIATDYVRLGLAIGQYDSLFVDSYYGPDSLSPKTPKSLVFPKDSFLVAVNSLQKKLKNYVRSENNNENKMRAVWLIDQLTAFSRRIKILGGEFDSFDEESMDLFGVLPPVFKEKNYQSLLSRLDKILPQGTGSLRDRYLSLTRRFRIVKERQDTVIKLAIAEARKRTLKYLSLPVGENYILKLTPDLAGSRFNRYKGNYTSEVSVNTGLPININSAIDIASHESYPGHHVYGLLREKNLYQEKGWIEISIAPLFSPMALVSEGSASYSVELAFPYADRIRFSKESLLPAAGLDTTGIELYFQALEIRHQLDYGVNEAAKGLVNKTMTEEQALHWLVTNCLYSDEGARAAIGLIKQFRSYVINYNYGKDIVKNYVESKTKSNNPAERWKMFGSLLYQQMRSKDLVR